MELKDLIEQIDAKITEKNDKYAALHRELDTFRGKEIGDDVDKVNNLLIEIQTAFRELYPALHFIATRHQYAVNICTDYDGFIESIKKAGGTTYDPDQVAKS